MSDADALIPLGRKSAAASTHFCAERLDGPDGHIWLDGNGKVTAGNGTLDTPKPNAFSLPAGNTEARRAWCPSSTAICRSSCLASFHKVLTADLRYVALRTVQVGDQIVSFDDERRPSERRTLYRTGTVEAIRHREADIYHVRLKSGKSFYVTNDHRWLVRRPDESGTRLWLRTDELRVGYHRAVKLADEWETASSYEAGWLAGMYDGEGCLYANGDVVQLTLSQKEGPVLDRARRAVSTVLGEKSHQHCAQTRDVQQLRIAGGRMQVAKALGVLRPTRLLPKFAPEMLGEVWTQDVDEVVSIEPHGREEITEIAVDAGTMIVEGYAHHNCYVHGLEANAAETFALYEHNGRMLLDVILRDAATTDAWACVLGDWISAHASAGFRWHVSGDVRSADHAHWIAAVANRSRNVRHWIYTRSLFALPWLLNDATEENLTVNVSCDAENYTAALSAWFGWHGRIRLCYLTTDGSVPDSLPKGSVVFPDYPMRWPDGAEQPAWLGELPSEIRRGVCPVDLRGKSEKRRCGPCSRCIDPVVVL